MNISSNFLLMNWPMGEQGETTGH